MHDELHIIESDEDALHRDSDVPIGSELLDEVPPAGQGGLRDAAVLLPLIRHEQRWQLLFIRRAHNDRDRHSGQVAFPGGAAEAGDDSPEATALRETREEIGLEATRVRLLARLDPYLTISRFRVTPIVGVVDWPSNLRLEADEVARAFPIPLDWLRNRDNLTLRARNTMDPQSARRHPILVFEPYDGEVLWGATARITVNFLKQLDDGGILLPSS